MQSIRLVRDLSRCRRGFTLIELILVVLLIGIMTALAAPRMSGYVQRTQVDTVSNQILADLAYARTLAVRSGRNVTVTLQPTAYQIQVNGAGAPAKQVNLKTDYPGLSVTATPSQLVFNSRGLLTTSSGSIAVSRGSQSASLQVMPTGRVYVN